MSDFNLRDVVVDVLDSTELADPSEVADETFRRLTRGQHADALRQSLRQTARVIMASRRNAPSAPTAAPKGSAKVRAIREQWRARLSDRVFTADGWKLLRDCVRDDLLFMAAERRRIAADNLASAERYEKLAAALPSDDATVGSLDDGSLADVLGRDAA